MGFCGKPAAETLGGVSRDCYQRVINLLLCGTGTVSTFSRVRAVQYSPGPGGAEVTSHRHHVHDVLQYISSLIHRLL